MVQLRYGESSSRSTTEMNLKHVLHMPYMPNTAGSASPRAFFLSIVVFSIMALQSSLPAAAAGVGTWNATTPSSALINMPSCVASNSYLYCLGGIFTSMYPTVSIGPTNAAEYAALSDNGIGTWINTTEYPIAVQGSACVVSNGYLYCIGGLTMGGYLGPRASTSTSTLAPHVLLSSDLTYYAQLSSTGIGTWHQSTPYPHNVTNPVCVASAGNIYCSGIGTYYAQLSSTGIGTWHQTSLNSQMAGSACSAYNGYVYCISRHSLGNTSDAYYAQLSSTGINQWHLTSAYPVPLQESTQNPCTAYNGYLYCFSAQVPNGIYLFNAYYAQLSSTGIAAWKSTSYPSMMLSPDCFAESGKIYCIGPNLSSYSSFYAPIQASPAGVFPTIPQVLSINITYIIALFVILIIVAALIYLHSSRKLSIPLLRRH